MSTKKTGEYTSLELYIVDNGLNIHLDVADGDTPEKIARIILLLNNENSIKQMAKIIGNKLLETKGEEYALRYLSMVENILTNKSSPIIKPSQVFAT